MGLEKRVKNMNIVVLLYRKTKDYFLNIKDNKVQRVLKTRFVNSVVSSSCLYNNETSLEGENIIRDRVDIRSSSVGKCSYICGGSNLPNCNIGAFCSISSGVHIQPWTHPITFVSTYPGFFDTCNNLPFGKGEKEFDESLICDDGHFTIIGNDVWIGENVTIKGGVKIGDGAIIGMNSLVTKDVPPYAIVGGNPAKIIRYRFDEDTIHKLLEIKWWDWPLEVIKERRELFTDINRFIELFGSE